MKQVPDRELSLGQRIKISEKHHWAKGQTGVIARPPAKMIDFLEEWASDFKRRVQGRSRVITFYWVKFDSARYDADGDGPYPEAAIADEYLLPID